MLKKLLAACAIVISLAPQVYASPNWELVGKTNDGETLSLDTSSVQTKLNAGEWLFFSYKVGNRQNIAKTASCSNGKLQSAKPGYIVDSTSKQAYADSVGSQNMLQRVCQLGKNAYGISDYQPVSQYSDNEIEYLATVNQLLKDSNNPSVDWVTNESKIKMGQNYCNFRSRGGSNRSYYSLFIDSFIANKLTDENVVLSKNFLITTVVGAGNYLCPEYKELD